MTDEELKQFGELAKKFEAKDKVAITKIVQQDLHPVFQDINDGGRTAANNDLKPKLDKAEADVVSLTTRATKAESDLKELEGKAPEVGKLREKFEKELIDERKKLGEQLEAKDGEILATRLEVARGKLVDKLADMFEVDREYASTVVVNRDDVKKRIRVEPKSSAIKVLKAGSEDMFIVPAEGKEPLEHLAEEIAGSIDDKWKGSKVREGSETTSKPGSKQTGDRFEATRKRAQAAEKEREKSREAGTGLERLGGRSRSL